MDIICENCQSKFKIPDEKVPKGQAFSVACPKCKSKIAIDTRSESTEEAKEVASPSAQPEVEQEKSLIDEVDSGTYDASDKPFDFIEEGAETALLCEPDPDTRTKIKLALGNMGYHITEAKTPMEALKQMRFHVFDLVIVNEMFGTQNPDENNVTRYLDRLSMDTRRNIYVALITSRFRTFDNMVAFNKSVNILINIKNIDEIEKILTRGITDAKAFYRVFREAMIKTGRA
jgi:predicted Zn finger-like uncharacterized protein